MATYKRRRMLRSARPSKRRKVYKKARRVVKRSSRRLRYRKSTAMTSRVSPVYRGLGALASIMRPTAVVTHTWVGSYKLTVGGTGLNQAMQVKANNLYDPCPAVTGWYNVSASRYGYMQSLYNKYCVLSAKCRVIMRADIANTNPQNTVVSGTGGGSIRLYTTENPTLKVGLTLDADGTLLGKTAWQCFLGDPDSTVHTWQPVVTGGSSCSVTRYFNVKKFFGYENLKDNDAVWADVGYGPTKVAFFCPWVQPMDQTTTPLMTSFNLEYRVSYKVMWRDPKDYAMWQGS